jgi:hypothetical protein
MSFGEYVFLAGFNQKTAKGDLFVKGNHEIPPWLLREKTLEDSRRYSTEGGHEPLISGAGRPYLLGGQPVGPTCQPLFVTSVLHCLLRCISVVTSSQFDLRAEDWCLRLYIPAYSLLGQKPSQILRAEKPETLIPYVHQDLELAIKRRLVLQLGYSRRSATTV